MKFIPLEIPDVILIESKVNQDPRGYFYESYRKDIFTLNGIKDDFVQDNYSRSSRGVLRGLHYQIDPRAQGKLVTVLEGKVLDVAVDLRQESRTFGKWVSCVLTSQKKQSLYVPKGFAHGICVLEDNTEFFYKVSDFYSPQHERGIIWSDPDLAIAWPKLDIPYILSDKDQKYPRLKEVFN